MAFVSLIPPPTFSTMRRKALKAFGAGGLVLASGQGSFAGGRYLSLGLLPDLTARVLFNQYEPVKQYLTAFARTKVTISSASSWSEFYRRAADHQFDVMVAAPHVARLMQKDLGFVPVASLAPRVEAALVCAKNQNAKQLNFMRGKTIVAANPASLVTVEGEVWLEKQGLRSGDDYISVNVRSADSVGILIERGDAIAGLVSLSDLNSHHPDVIKNLKVVQVYAVLPSLVIVLDPVRSQLSASALSNAFHDFAQSPLAATFKQRSGSQIEGKVSENFASSMDQYLAMTRQMLNI